jgi:putative Holliday junction resolvase
MPNFLGVDYGTKRIGLAWADELGIALPLNAIPGVDDSNWNVRFRKVLEQKKIGQIVVGYPIHMDGSVGLRAKEVDGFIDELESIFKIPVFRVDERLTSVAAEEGLNKISSKKKDLGKIDSSAASIILQDFIENKKVISQSDI